MLDPRRDRQLDATAVLADPVRRRLYDYVVRAGRDVSRDGAARGVKIDRSLAAFHLEKLVDAGLLEASYRRLSGKGGPGAGRPSKVYRRAAGEISVTLPARRYETAAQLLATAIESSSSRATARALGEAAHAMGKRLGAEGGTIERVLGRNGFEPFQDGKTLRLRNCPFHALAEAHRDLVCGMNLALIEGFVDGCGAKGSTVALEPGDGRCCVAIRRSG
jgi:predicted ArsR family transcriptional regulator